MKSIVIINQSSGYLTTDIANAFHSAGYEVAMIYGAIGENERPLNDHIIVEKITPYDRSSGLRRIKTWLLGTNQIFKLLKSKYKKYEVLYVTNPPTSYLCSLFLKNEFSIVVFDAYPDALVNIGITTRNPVYKIWAGLNKKLYRKAKVIFTLSEGMASQISSYISKDRITVVPCWSANSKFAPIAKGENPFIAKHNLQDKFIVLYSGNMGLTHNVEVLLKCAKRIKLNNDILFLLIGGGQKRLELEQYVKENGLNNCMFMDRLPADSLPYSLASADLGVVTVNNETASVSVPSKTFNLMAVGAPLLCIAPENAEVSMIVDKYCNGGSYKASDIDGITDYILKLYGDESYKNRLSCNSLNATKDFSVANANKYVDCISRKKM